MKVRLPAYSLVFIADPLRSFPFLALHVLRRDYRIVQMDSGAY